jgi:hypothetical protein
VPANRADLGDLLSRLTEVEELLRFPTVKGHVERACKLLVSIARNAPTRAIGDISMRLTSDASALARSRPDASQQTLDASIKQLRSALEEAERAAPGKTP